MSRSRLALLTGPVGIGKTTIAGRVVELARHRGIACRGVLAPALRNAGLKIGIAGVDLATGERRTLACTSCDMKGPRLGSYSFDAEALEWATSIILEALSPTQGAEATAENAALVVVDEIGKLELWQRLGLAAVLPALASCPSACVLVIVRESLLDELRARLGDACPLLFWAGEETRDTLPGRIADELL